MDEPEQPPKGSPFSTACVFIALIGIFALMALVLTLGNVAQHL